MMNFAFKTMNFASKLEVFVLKMMNLEFKMMNSVLKIVNSVLTAAPPPTQRSKLRPRRSRDQTYVKDRVGQIQPKLNQKKRLFSSQIRSQPRPLSLMIPVIPRNVNHIVISRCVLGTAACTYGWFGGVDGALPPAPGHTPTPRRAEFTYLQASFDLSIAGMYIRSRQHRERSINRRHVYTKQTAGLHVRGGHLHVGLLGSVVLQNSSFLMHISSF